MSSLYSLTLAIIPINVFSLSKFSWLEGNLNNVFTEKLELTGLF